MSNKAFNKGTRPEVKDPVAEAQAAQMAEYQTTGATDGEPATNATESEQVLAVLNTATPSEPAPEVNTSNAAAPAEVVVKEVAQSREITQSNILKDVKQRQAQGTVIRQTGGQARETSPATVTAAEHVASNSFRALMDKELKSGTTNAVSLISFLDVYVKAMAPRKITSTADILRMQEGLLDTLLAVINRAPAKEFNRLWNIAVQYVKEYKEACFSPLYFSRGARDWKRDPKQFQLLSSLINLLLATARDKNTVTDVVNLEAVVGNGFSEDARGRIFSFYS